ncbi:DUF885 domain-containing protein [Brevundimonas sp. 2R-24]|uniref:DUF885 domain-containing protein n=1 Tax=Peiella sedimenti TaxID=3061083 RepID=A0ABT8SHF9_9CAUL|nr:DUF885 domain-containing protein [Caulobacteraceae bacterium XZ-24]
MAITRRTTLGWLTAGAASAPLLSACATAPVVPSGSDSAFGQIAAQWLDESLRLSPVAATGLGDHRFDHLVDDVSTAGRAAQVNLARSVLTRLDALPSEGLSRADQVDAALLRQNLRAQIWSDAELQSWAWDPLTYAATAGGALYSLQAREFAPLPDRLRSATARMRALPALLAESRRQLQPARVPEIHATTAVGQNRGLHSLVDGFTAEANALQGAEREALLSAAAQLKAAVDEHQRWLETELVPNARGNWRIGARLYDQKLAYALNSDLTRQEIVRRGERALADTRAQMYVLATRILAGRPGAPETPANPNADQQQHAIEAALELAYAEKPGRNAIVSTAEAMLEQTTAFVREKDLVTVPNDPIRIGLVPEFQRGVALAYCDAPGPLDRGQATYYKIAPLPEDWTDAQVDSFLREYNLRSMQELTIHEAMPGHYLQLAHSNRYPSVIRAVLGSGTFTEGWACYAQDVMAEAGYLGGEDLYQLVHLKWVLRMIANAMLDPAVHAGDMTRDQAIDLMVRGTFQQEREAAGKWTRAQLSSAQLPTYFVGWEEHWEARRAAERAWGSGFNLKRYHDGLLSFGSPPVRYARALLLDEAIPA